MRHLSVTLLTVGVATMLSACGGGSGGGSGIAAIGGARPVVTPATTNTTTSATTTNTSNTTGTTNTTGTSTAAPVANPAGSGASSAAAVVTGSNGNSALVLSTDILPTRPHGGVVSGTTVNRIITGTSSALSANNLDVLIVNGKTYDLSKKAGNGFLVSGFDGNGAPRSVNILVSNYLEDTRYGWVQDETSPNNPRLHAFYHGNITDQQSMPVGGVVQYRGYGAASCTEAACKTGKSGDRKTAVVDLSADFSKRTLTGTIKMSTDDFQSFTVDTRINGNKFSGISKDRTRAEGAFFGPTGEELSGLFSNERQGWAGAFGAERQE